ncbi:YuzF family protein [Natribacillus halophilus]|uniref:DUF2642 domain-containing protein n=1 Tax=Natribacillus halophilus TaxID=549003 RepID=A0A1G8PJT0_9BACI|nr:YuzF family protein [Natribacillus halophilus]SDI92090.1 Protein of unknown function [Natribacillus halophilus]
MSHIEWTLSDPFVYQGLLELEGEMIGIQTTRGTLRGKLESVQPDHIMVEMGGRLFSVRVAQIIWFYRDEDDKKHHE